MIILAGIVVGEIVTLIALFDTPRVVMTGVLITMARVVMIVLVTLMVILKVMYTVTKPLLESFSTF